VAEGLVVMVTLTAVGRRRGREVGVRVGVKVGASCVGMAEGLEVGVQVGGRARGCLVAGAATEPEGEGTAGGAALSATGRWMEGFIW